MPGGLGDARAPAAGTEADPGRKVGGFAVAPLPGGLGAECRGIDLSLPLSEATRSAIHAAFLGYQILILRDQRMSEEDLRNFASIFGAVEGNIFRKDDGGTLEDVHLISNFDASGKPSDDPYLKSNFNWHTDKAYLPVPAMLTMLHAVELPPQGGDTQFADMNRAYDALPDDLKRQIAGKRVVHSFEYMRTSTGDRPLTDAERKSTPPVTHPLVRTHPETGQKSLYIGMYSAGVVGMDEGEGRGLLDRLIAHATQPRFVYTHQWRPGDLVFWDNRCLLHRAVRNYEVGKHRRVLRRVVVRGSVPY